MSATVMKLDGVACILSMARDITEVRAAREVLEQHQQQLEQLVQQRTAALHDAETKYRTVADFAYDWETWVDDAGHWLYCSPACQRVTGYRAEEFLARPALYVDTVSYTHLDVYKRQVLVQFGEHHQSSRSVCHAGPQVEVLPLSLIHI